MILGIYHIVFLLSSSSSVVSKIVTTVQQESNVTLTVSAAPSVLVKNDSNELSPVSTAPTVQPTTASVSPLNEQKMIKTSWTMKSEIVYFRLTINSICIKIRGPTTWKEKNFMKHRTFHRLLQIIRKYIWLFNVLLKDKIHITLLIS